jgi:DNA-binding winged helix-turn-helix (wHTH) protein
MPPTFKANMSAEVSESNPLPLTFRQAEVDMIGRCLRAGDSCSVIGVSGMAKSNLFRHLLRLSVRRHYLDGDCLRYLFLSLSAHELGIISEQAIYSLLYERLISGLRQQGLAEDSAGLSEELSRWTSLPTDALLVQRAFLQLLQTVMASDPARNLVILFDQFDDLYQRLNPRFFANLRAIRDEYKYRVSYVVFTREELPRLCDAPECEEFYELFSSNVIGLGPYDLNDARLLLSRVGGRYGQTPEAGVSERLIEWTGGHPGLLKATCMATLHGVKTLPGDTAQALDSLLGVEDVRTECAKLWGSLSDEEQKALQALVIHKLNASRDGETIRRLRLKNLLIDVGEAIAPFSPLFTAYIAKQKAEALFTTKISAGPIRIDAAGEVWVNEKRVTPPPSKRELSLLEYLCLDPGRLRTKDEIIAIVYPEEYRSGEGVSDDALNALVKRLRDRLEASAGTHNFIVTVRGKGYRLNLNG